MKNAEIERPKTLAEDAAETERPKTLAKDAAETERQRKLAEDAAETERQRKLAEDAAEDAKKKEWQLFFHSFYHLYMKDLEEDRQEWAAAKEQTEQYLQFLAEHCDEIFTGLLHLDDMISELFRADESSEEKKETREKLLQETALSRREFCAIALASQAKKPQFMSRAQAVFSWRKGGSTPPAGFLKECTAEADDAIAQYYMGNPDRMRRLIADGLQTACNEFYSQKDPEAAMLWAHHVNTLVGIISTHKDLAGNVLQASLLEKAAKVATMGKIMERGTEALARLKQMQMNQVPVQQGEKIQREAEVILLCETEKQRNKEAILLGPGRNRAKEIPLPVR